MIPFEDFESASKAALTFLQKKLGFGLWMVTRTESDDWIVLQCLDDGYGVKNGDVFRWADSFCSQMVQGLGPCIAPNSDLVPAYAKAPIGQQVPIAAYIGVPLLDAEGSLFGTLCAIDRVPHPETLNDELPLVELIGGLLSTLLASELKLSAQERQNTVSAVPLLDPVTGLMNAIGWNRIAEGEERRCKMYGHAACVVFINLQSLSSFPNRDDVLKKVAGAIRSSLGVDDSAARLIDDKFAIMLLDRSHETAAAWVKQLELKLKKAGMPVVTGFACRVPNSGLEMALEMAQQAV